MTPLTPGQIDDVETFVLDLEHHRRVTSDMDDAARADHARGVALVRLAFADLRVRSAAGEMLEALKDMTARFERACRVSRSDDEYIALATEGARAAISRATGGRA